MNTCGRCDHHRMEGPLAKHGYGMCSVRQDHAMRAGIATSVHATCRIGLFQEKKQTDSFTAPQNAPEA